jgi:NAD(P)-dependent dehydrogenase (short-subunit alcohol dehydrogenase family)
MATVFSPVSEISAEEYRRVTEVTYLGCVHGTMAALKLMRPRGRGAIVQVGSALAYRGIPLQAAYCGAKHAIRGFTNSLRTELLHDRSAISLSIVELPAMNTPQFEWARTHMPDRPRPMGRVYQPEAAAEAVWKAASRGGREYWLGRTTAMTILGNTIAPGLMDRLLARTAVDGQSRGVPVSPKRRDNLFSPVGPLHATHGAFDGQAHDGALLVSGEAARAGAVIAGALGFLGLGLALGRLARN